MKFGEIYDYRTAEEAKKYLGKRGAFSDNLHHITESPSQCFEGTLEKVEEGESCPFNGEVRWSYQFFRPVLEEELMTNRQLAEWLAKGYGECSYKDTKQVSHSLPYSEGDEDKPVEDYILIRRWNDTEWVKPTRAIYEEDCMPNTAINKEDCK